MGDVKEEEVGQIEKSDFPTKAKVDLCSTTSFAHTKKRREAAVVVLNGRIRKVIIAGLEKE